jgi:uncharacterized protein (TIGR02271 family)
MTQTQPQMSEAYDWRGRTVVDSDGQKIGRLDEVYLDEETGRLEWALVHTGLFGTKSTFVPLSAAAPSGEDIRVPFTKEQVKDAPRVEPDGELSQDEEAQLYGHYGLDYGEARSGSGLPEGTHRGGASQEPDEAMTRSEEEVRVGTAPRERGRARLRKYVVTEEVTQRVPVRREKARIEREPITDENVGEATAGPDISEAEHEVPLQEEEPVVEKRAVPKERVRMTKETETDEARIAEEVRKERIEAEGDEPTPRR